MASPHPSGPRVAVLGATGLVGREMLRLLEASSVEPSEVRALASSRSAGARLPYGEGELEVVPVSPEALEGLDLLLASAGGAVSRQWLPLARELGVVCIDNTSAFRLDPGVPLVVPEVNPQTLDGISLGRGAIIANPNCSTIQMVVALAPLHEAFGLRRVVVDTYQSISGAGAGATRLFAEDLARAAAPTAGVSPSPVGLGLDVLPRIGELDAQGESSEEAKMVHETRKILDANLPVDATCVRVPVVQGHAEALTVETDRPCSVEEALEALRAAPGVEVHAGDSIPTPRALERTPGVHVGRVRTSRAFRSGLKLWVVADNLIKGAAGNALQIAELVTSSSLSRT